MASQDNEKAAQVALRIILAFMQDKERWYTRKKQWFGMYQLHDPNKLYEHLIGGEILRHLNDHIVFIRLGQALNAK